MRPTFAPKRTLPPRTLRVGALHPASTLLARLTFPVIEDIGAVGYLREAIQYAAAHRAGVLVVGRKGLGKSLAMERAAVEFERQEEEARRASADYERRALRIVPPIRAADRVTLIKALYAQELGALPARLGRGGDAVLLADLVAAWQEAGVAVVVFDEAEGLSDAALDVCRDIMARSAAGAARLSGDLDAFRATGIGVVLVGAPELEDRLRRSAEFGQRWTQRYTLGGLPDGELPAVYAAYLPCFAAEAERRGADGWAALVVKAAAPVVAGVVRRVEHHVRRYVTLCLENHEPTPREAADIAFDEGLFLRALEELAELPVAS